MEGTSNSGKGNGTGICGKFSKEDTFEGAGEDGCGLRAINSTQDGCGLNATDGA